MSGKRTDSDSEIDEDEERKPSAVSKSLEQRTSRSLATMHQDTVHGEEGKGEKLDAADYVPAARSGLKRASSETDASTDTAMAGPNKLPSHLARSRGKGRMRLPEKLMEFLNAEVSPDVVWWLQEGSAFAFESSRVQEEFLDIYFRGTKLSSFIRSLNRWGFRRIFLSSLPKSAMCFHHKMFKRNDPQLLKRMELSSYTPLASQSAFEYEGVGGDQMSTEEGQGTEAAGFQGRASGPESQHVTEQQLSAVSLLLNEALGGSSTNIQAPLSQPQMSSGTFQDLHTFPQPSTSTTPQSQSASLLEQELLRQLGRGQAPQRSDLLPLLQSLVAQETQRNDSISINLALHNLLRDAAHSNLLNQLLQPPQPQLPPVPVPRPPPQPQIPPPPAIGPLDTASQQVLVQLMVELTRSQTAPPEAGNQAPLPQPAPAQPQVEPVSLLHQLALQQLLSMQQDQSGTSSTQGRPPPNLDPSRHQRDDSTGAP